MSQKEQSASSTADREIVLNRLLNAPRELVWKVWTQPEHIVQWWGPDGFTTKIDDMDFRVGGEWNYMMYGPDGVAYPNKVVYSNIVEPELIEYSHGSGIENDPQAFNVTVSFMEQNGKTELTMRAIFQTAEARNFVVENFGAIEGGKQNINKLEQYLISIAN